MQDIKDQETRKKIFERTGDYIIIVRTEDANEF